MHRFKDKVKQELIDIPEIVGDLEIINSSGSLLISGSKGYAIYDRDFNCIEAMALDKDIRG